MSITPQAILPFGRFLGNDSDHNFAHLADDFLKAARFANNGFANLPKWPTYFLAFQALENYLKSYLLRMGATLDHVHHDIGHKLRDALDEAKSRGLVLKVPSSIEDAIMELSELYSKREFQYRSIGQWKLIPPHIVIDFVDEIRMASGN
jgi:HEPN domain-containing protein